MVTLVQLLYLCALVLMLAVGYWSVSWIGSKLPAGFKEVLGLTRRKKPIQPHKQSPFILTRSGVNMDNRRKQILKQQQFHAQPTTSKVPSASNTDTSTPTAHTHTHHATSAHSLTSSFSTLPSHPPSFLPHTNSEAAIIAAEALDRRLATMADSTISSISATPTTATSASSNSASQPIQRRSSQSSHGPSTSIGGSGWLQRAAIIEDYQPNANQTK